jgi:hypothetical protein
VSVGIVHYPCGCRMSARGVVVVRWQRCSLGHAGQLAHDLLRVVEGKAHTLEARERCSDARCQHEAARMKCARQWAVKSAEIESGDE